MFEDDDYSQDRKFLHFDDTVAPDYYCQVCKVKMNSALTWSKHIDGRPHQKKMVSASIEVLCRTTAVQDADVQQIKVSGDPFNIRTKPVNAIAQIQREIETDPKNYFAGLDFVREIWQKDLLKPIYICTMCKVDCQHTTIISHVTGFRHRINYIKMKDPVKFNSFKDLSEKKSILSELVAEHTGRMEGEFGRGIITVHKEIDMKDEGVSDDDLTERPMEIEPAIQSVSNAEIVDAIRQSTPSVQKKIMAKVNYPDARDSRPMIAAEIKKLQEMKFQCIKRHIDLLSDKEQLEIGAAFMVEDYSFIDEFNAEHFGLKPLH